MTWIKTVPPSKGDDRLRAARQAQSAMYINRVADALGVGKS